jgi:transmembrane 9 superfamily protein 3
MFVYVAMSPVNGYTGGSLYSRMGGRDWIHHMVVSAFLVPALVCGTAFFINFIAMYYHASRAIPIGTMIAIMCICLFIILPLTMVGTVLGRNLAGQPNYPCRINAVPRPIPEKKWLVHCIHREYDTVNNACLHLTRSLTLTFSLALSQP